MMATKPSGITPRMIKYGNGITAVRALPKAKGKRPAVIILHERYGIDQHTKDLTARLAQAGFAGLAPDLFHRFTGDRQAILSLSHSPAKHFFKNAIIKLHASLAASLR